MIFAFIPSPSFSQFELGPLTLHAYALCIIAGVVVAIIVGDRRYRAAGGSAGVVSDVAIVAVPAGVIGGRLYHVVTSPDAYFGKGGDLLSALYIWRGGLGIWGAIALGFAGAYVAYRRRNYEKSIPFARFADALAPALLLAQAIGRWGNWFNKELFGSPLNAPWALEIPPLYRPAGFSEFATYHPTFLYESLWCFAIAILLMKMNFSSFAPGAVFASYVALYSLGRGVIESLRIDEAHHILGVRLNIWTSAILFISALAYLVKARKKIA